MAYYGKREWLAKIRVSKGLSQDLVAAMAEMSQAMYCKIENGYRDPSNEQAKAIAKVLEFEVERFDDEDRAAKEAAV